MGARILNRRPIGNPINNVTDRALRYRANADPPPGPKICRYCGSRRNVEIHHKDGDESNTERSNLAWACRSCNTAIGIEHARRGIGRRTRQYNAGATTGAQWATAVSSRRGSGAMDYEEAGRLIHDTPHARRTRFQKQLWAARKKIYGRSGRATPARDSEVPF